jgi:hypothetical protein
MAMNRCSLLALLFTCACGGAIDKPDETSQASTTSSASTIGAPCVFAMENDPTFAGFDEKEVNLETPAGYVSGDTLCIANHFRGRVSCPHGQDACKTPGGVPVTPSFGAYVEAQCVGRTADKAVYTSCRCANVEGRSDDGARYCACPDDFSCTSLVSRVGPETPRTALSGSYCIKKGTDYTPGACP